MPLKHGSSQKTISSNIRELYNHGSQPRSRDQIIAIAMSQARRHPKADGGSAVQGPPAGGAPPVPYIPDLPDTQTYRAAPPPPPPPQQQARSAARQQQPDPPQIGKWLAGEIAKTGKLPPLPQGIKGGDITGATDMMMAADQAGLLTPQERSAAMKFLGITPQAPFVNPNGAPRYKQIRQGIETGGALHRALKLAHALAEGGSSGGLSLTGAPGTPVTPPFAGPIHSSVAGRTDQHEMSVKPGSYVIPADIVSIKGEGNTLAGFNAVKSAFAGLNLTGGIKLPPGHKGRYGPPSISIPGLQAHKPPAHAKTKGHEGRAEGGAADGDDENVPIIAAGGEVVVPPELIAAKFGSLDHGHKTLDAWVLHERAQEIKRLKTTPPPKK